MRRTLILCAHGTVDRRGRAILGGLANAVRKEAPHDAVIAESFVDGPEPTLSQVVRATSGPRTVIPLVPLADDVTRSSIRTATEDEPLATVAAPLGPDWVLAEVGVRRLIEAGTRPDDTIVLAADHVHDSHAVEDVAQAARLLSAVWGGAVHVGALGGQDIALGDAIDVARAYGRRVVLTPYVMTHSAALDEMRAAGADMVTEPFLDAKAPDPRLVALILSRATTRAHWPQPATAE